MVPLLYFQKKNHNSLMRMNLQDIYQERELVLVVIKVRLTFVGIKLGLAS